MLGWEFPPFKSGGLGTACLGLTKGLSKQGVDITFVMPKAKGEISSSHVHLIVADRIGQTAEKVSYGDIKVKGITSLLKGYVDSQQYAEIWYKTTQEQQKAVSESSDEVYGKNLFEEVGRFSQKASLIAQNENFDIIHAHDWMTYPAAIAAKRMTNKPLVVHIHATEMDRTAGHPDPIVFDLERQGFEQADMIIAVSEWTRQKVINHYNIPPEKVQVVHNGVEMYNLSDTSKHTLGADDKIILFLGRLTIQKGPEHFLWAAKKVAEVEPNVKFVIAGSGDMQNRMVEEAVNLGISDKVIFTGFLSGADIDRAYRMADLYVMPSISEPFGITPLESMKNGTPTLISKQSGVSEVVKHCLKVDFWDIDQMANKMTSVIKYKDLQSTLSDEGLQEVQNITWDVSADKCINIYKDMIPR